jgi:hypothetical protein
MKKCNYRKCDNKVEGVYKLYCCRRCKNSEAVYRLRDNKPKGKIGRPKQVYKRINDLTEEDRRILELLMKKVD